MRLALFDFDGTITRKDTFIEVIKFHKGEFQLLLGLIALSPVLVAYKLKIIKNWRAKEIVFGHFFKGISKEGFESVGSQFANTALPSLIRLSAERSIREHKAAGDRVVIVTASAEEWIGPWVKKLGVEVISTKWEIRNGYLTGKILGQNCYGPEKASRIKSQIDLSTFTEIYAYGDTSGDFEMLNLATKKYYRYFKD